MLGRKHDIIFFGSFSGAQYANGVLKIEEHAAPARTGCITHEKRTCGFGFGMFQWMFGRTGKVLLKYKEWYSDYTELTYEERFNVEWEYFKEEMRTDYYKKALTLYTENKTGDVNEDAQTAAEVFRRRYEGNKDSDGIREARDFASCWVEELKLIDWAEE